MSTLTLKREAKALIDAMSPAQLWAASEFLAFVKSRELDSTTLELLSIPGFEASFAGGMKGHQGGPHQTLARCDPTYSVELSQEAQRFNSRCTKPVAKKLARCFEWLQENPREGNNVKPLKGKLAGFCRYRAGDLRVVYMMRRSSRHRVRDHHRQAQ